MLVWMQTACERIYLAICSQSCKTGAPERIPTIHTHLLFHMLQTIASGSCCFNLIDFLLPEYLCDQHIANSLVAFLNFQLQIIIIDFVSSTRLSYSDKSRFLLPLFCLQEGKAKQILATKIHDTEKRYSRTSLILNATYSSITETLAEEGGETDAATLPTSQEGAFPSSGRQQVASPENDSCSLVLENPATHDWQ